MSGNLMSKAAVDHEKTFDAMIKSLSDGASEACSSEPVYNAQIKSLKEVMERKETKRVIYDSMISDILNNITLGLYRNSPPKQE